MSHAESMLANLQRWRTTGAITAEQHDALSALVRRERLSVYVELHTILYLGVVAFIAGVGWTIKTHFAGLGDAAILSALTLTCGASFYYCFTRGPAYSTERVAPPGLAFDYVLYLGCLVFGLELGYLEFRFELLRSNWDHYLLLSATVFFALAYRFDNRFVLSLALSTLAGWFGLRLSGFPDRIAESLRGIAILYGGLVAAAGALLYNAALKKHFLDTYLHVAANVVFMALLSALVGRDAAILYLLALIGLAAGVIAGGLKWRQFAFVVYGVVYGYAGISARVLHEIGSFRGALAYFVISSLIVIGTLVTLARRFGRDE